MTSLADRYIPLSTFFLTNSSSSGVRDTFIITHPYFLHALPLPLNNKLCQSLLSECRNAPSALTAVFAFWGCLLVPGPSDRSIWSFCRTGQMREFADLRVAPP